MKERIREFINSLKKLTKQKEFRKRLLIGIGVFVLLVGSKYVFHLSVVKLPSLEEQGLGITIMDRENRKAAVIQKEGEKSPIPLSKISDTVMKAVVSVEDRSFYSHLGVDPFGIARATFTNIKERDLVEGGSTITQQLMKTMFFEFNDRSLRRKILEVVMALDVEAGYSKDKIIETYLNQIYFGRGAWGIEKAARTYFDKPASKLTVAESAFLAGLIKAPSTYGSEKNAKVARERQLDVIKDMVECGYLTDKQAEAARAEKLKFSKKIARRKYPFYTNHVVEILKEELGENNVWNRPLTVYTNMDMEAQEIAEVELAKEIRRTTKALDQGALISISLEDGGVLAMVGGADPYKESQWNRALKPHTAGSTFKPFVYLAALKNNTIGPSTVLYDSPISIPDKEEGKEYKPENYDRKFLGPLTVRDALRLSRNVCAVKVAMDTGLGKVVDCARKAGISSEIKEYPSMALGTAAVTPLELANAYATIARGGEFIPPQFIRSILDKDDKLIKQFEHQRKRVLPEQPCLQILDGMVDVVKKGTGRRAYLPGIQVAGKTGTADGNRDIWFVGMTPEVVTAVWAGNDKNKAINSGAVTGGSVTARIWAKYMTDYHKRNSKPQIAFKNPKHPLDDKLPFYITMKMSMEETIDDFSASLKEASNSISKGKSLIKNVTQTLKKIF